MKPKSIFSHGYSEEDGPTKYKIEKHIEELKEYIERINSIGSFEQREIFIQFLVICVEYFFNLGFRKALNHISSLSNILKTGVFDAGAQEFFEFKLNAVKIAVWLLSLERVFVKELGFKKKDAKNEALSLFLDVLSNERQVLKEKQEV